MSAGDELGSDPSAQARDASLGAHRRVHLVGIGGAGMSAIAAVLVEMGLEVSGSDLRDSATLERLRALGVRVEIGHAAEHLGDSDLVAISTAIPARNPELVAAHERGLPVWSRAAMLVAISRLRRAIAVAGTHGKTTTSSMLALILVEAGLEPAFLIGGDVNEIGTNAAWGSGPHLVVEADESDGTFLELSPEIAIVTSVEADHLEHYGSVDALEAAFRSFLERTPRAIVCADDAGARRVAPPDALTYGFAADAMVRIRDFSSGRAEVHFTLDRAGEAPLELEVPVPGAHNACNAAAAVLAALAVGADPVDAQRALARFGGVARRFEFRGEAAGVTFVDDYAHLPTECAAALGAARGGGWQRIVCVFQPHRFSRTGALAASFADAFGEADELVVTEIYPAGETPRPGVSGRLVADSVRAAHGAAHVEFVADRADLIAHVRRLLRPGDLCLTLGAGDLTSLPDELAAVLR